MSPGVHSELNMGTACLCFDGIREGERGRVRNVRCLFKGEGCIKLLGSFDAIKDMYPLMLSRESGHVTV